MEPKTVVVKSHELDSYGNTRFTDKDDNEYKVGEKRPKEMHDLIQDGVAVQLFYKVFNDVDYISDVKSVEGGLPPAREPAPVTEHPPEAPPSKTKPAIDARSREIRSMICYKKIGELVREDKMVEVFGEDIAKLLTSYYSDFIQKNL